VHDDDVTLASLKLAEAAFQDAQVWLAADQQR
jgi:hypothetical protein